MLPKVPHHSGSSSSRCASDKRCYRTEPDAGRVAKWDAAARSTDAASWLVAQWTCAHSRPAGTCY
jgi:hypothetical protein